MADRRVAVVEDADVARVPGIGDVEDARVVVVETVEPSSNCRLVEPRAVLAEPALVAVLALVARWLSTVMFDLLVTSRIVSPVSVEPPLKPLQQ